MMTSSRNIYVVDTFDTKADELIHVAHLIKKQGMMAILVDISTQNPSHHADIAAKTVASFHLSS